jgi:multidrug efflux pump subunit AcrA (membrane-fusion protein)
VKYSKTPLAILAALSTSLALADDFKTIDGKEYKNVTVSREEPDGIVLKSKSGISKVYFTELPKEVQERFHYDARQAAQYTAKTIEQNNLSRQQQAEEAQKRAEQAAAQLAMRRQQQQAEIERQQRQDAEAQRRRREVEQQPQTPTAAQSTPHSRSQEGIPEHTYELLQDYTIGFGGVSIRLRRGQQYHGRILVDHAEIDRDGRSYTVPSGILRPID